MNCRKVEDLLSAYIDGEVTGRQCVELEAHVSHCSACHEELETLRAAIALLAAPKQMARPEGLLEEFKAKYLPEAETAPGWGIRLPVLPRVDWAALGRVMVPVGGMAAAAAAAFLVALHSQPLVVGHPGATAPPALRRVASLPLALRGAGPAATTETPGAAEPRTPRVERHAAPPEATRRESEHPFRHFSERPAVAASAGPRRRSRHRAWASAVALHPAHHRHQPSPMYQLAGRPRLTPPVDDATLQRAVQQHEDAVPSPEMQWQDQVVMIRRTPSAAPTDEGYGEASCKDLATGKTEKSIAIGSEPLPAAPPGTSSGDAGGVK